MPSLNQVRYIAEAIESVFVQDWDDIELLIIDGGSTDGTVEYLKSLTPPDHLTYHWWSAADDGPAAAVNRGMRNATGEILGWLNSDDRYLAGSIRRAVAALFDHPEWLIVYGNAEHINSSGQILGTYPTRQPNAGLSGFLDGCFICQPTVFFRRSTLDAVNRPELLDQSLQTTFDLDLWLQLFAKHAARIGFIDAIQAQSRLHKLCITRRMSTTAAFEAIELLNQQIGEAPSHWIMTAGRSLIAQHENNDSATETQSKIDQLLLSATHYLKPGSEPEIRKLRTKLKRELNYHVSQIKAPVKANRASPLLSPLRWWRQKRAQQIIARSDYFDLEWYLNRYAKVMKRETNPVLHYLMQSVAKGLDPSPRFSNKFYLEYHPDVKISGMNPLLHFEMYGRNEGRLISPAKKIQPADEHLGENRFHA
jgi:glycosyltransferase involved in cell wall biosynthesis